MVKNDSLYIIAIVAVVAVVGLVIIATGSNTVSEVEELPGFAEDSSAAIAGQAFRTGGKQKAWVSNRKMVRPSYTRIPGTESTRGTSTTEEPACEQVSYYPDNDGDGLAALTATSSGEACTDEIMDMTNVATSRTDCDDADSAYGDWLDAQYCRDLIGATSGDGPDGIIDLLNNIPIDCKTGAELLDDNLVTDSSISIPRGILGFTSSWSLQSYGPYGINISGHQNLTEQQYTDLVQLEGCHEAIMVYQYSTIYGTIDPHAFYYRTGSNYGY